MGKDIRQPARGHGEPEDLRNTYIARPWGDRPVFVGTDIPIIGTHVRRLESGLWVPQARTPRQPIDAVHTFITASDLIGRPITLAEFQAAIQQASAAAFVRALAGLLAPLETESVIDKEVQVRLATGFLRDAGLNRALTAIEEGRIFMAPQIVLVAMKTAMVLAPAEGSDSVEAGPLLTVLLFIGDLLGSPPSADDERWRGFPAGTSMEVIRNQNFNRNTRMATLMGRYWRIWHELPPQRMAAGDQAPVDEFREETGCRPEELMLFGLWCWTSASKGLTHLPNEWVTEIPIETEAKKACLALMSSSLADAAIRAAQESVVDGVHWSFLAFRDRPLVQLPDGSLVILSARFTAERVFGGAMYWTLNDRANRLDSDQKNGPRWQAFKNLHAASVEAYVEEVMSAWRPPDGDRPRAFHEEDMVAAWGTGVPVCDLALDYEWGWACVEVNSRRFGYGAATGAGADEMDRELQLLIEAKSGRQLNSTVERLRTDGHRLAGRENRARRYFPVMFVAHGFPTNPLSVEAIREKLRGESRLQGDDVAPLELLDLDELDLLDAVRDQAGIELVRILRDKHDSPFFRSSITDFLLLGTDLRPRDSRRIDALFRAAHEVALRSSDDPTLYARLDQEDESRH